MPAGPMRGEAELPGTGLPVGALGEAELDLLELIAHGYGNREIARRLGVSIAILDARICELFRRFGVGSHLAAVAPPEDRSAQDTGTEPPVGGAPVAYSLPPQYLRGV